MYLEDYNEKHSDNPIKLAYAEADTATFIHNVTAGRYPAYICNESYVEQVEKQLGIDADVVPIENSDEIQDSRAYFLFRKDDTSIVNCREIKDKEDNK